MTPKAYNHWDDAKHWLRIVMPINEFEEEEWDELITGWTYIILLCSGKGQWRHNDGRLIDAI